MSTNTKQVSERWPVRYESWDDLLADARGLAGKNVRPLGNWSQGQIYEHLARSFNGSIDGLDFALPAPIRWMMSLVMKRKFLTNAIPAGFKSTDKLVAGETSAEQGLASLEAAVARQRQEPNRAMHPAFGNIGREGWDQFNLRHAELHMSFLVNGEG
jgi:hypothetical protein